MANLDFWGVKIGDVNSMAIVPSNAQSLKLRVPSQEVVNVNAQHTIKVPIKVDQFDHVAGLEFILEWDPTILQYTGHDMRSPIGGDTGETKISNGKLTFLWFDETGGNQTLPSNTTLFEAEFSVIRPINTTIGFDQTSRPSLVAKDVSSTLFREGRSTSRNSNTILTLLSPILQPGQITFPTSIPTMNQWGLIIFCLLILNMSVIVIRKRELLKARMVD